MLDNALSQTAPMQDSTVRQSTINLVVHPRYSHSLYLPLDAQARMMEAVRFGTHLKTPVNVLLTINAEHLKRIGSESVFEIGHLWDGFQTFYELLRKWVKNRGVPWSCVWVREYTGGRNEQYGEHWHLSLHLPKKHREAFACQLAIWTGASVGNQGQDPTCIAISEKREWHLKQCRGANVGAYLGKATPKTRLRYGRKVPNSLRQCFRHHGGDGRIEGQRFGISRSLDKTEQKRQGWGMAGPRDAICATLSAK